jgi:hypothetical protein
VLLHVVASPIGIDDAVDAISWLELRAGFEIMQDSPIVRIGNFKHSQLTGVGRRGYWNDETRIKYLSAAGGIKRGTIQNQGGAWIRNAWRPALNHLGIEFKKK